MYTTKLMVLAQEIYRSEATRGMQCVGRISDRDCESIMKTTQKQLFNFVSHCFYIMWERL
jgi:hypothetical protein